MPARIIRGRESWFVDAELKSDNLKDYPTKIYQADRRVWVIEYALNRMRVIRTKSQIDGFRKRLVDSHKPEKLTEALIECILNSTPEYWRANDLFYRAVIAEYKKQREGSK